MRSPRYVNYEGVVFCVSLNEFAKILLGGLPVQPTQNFIYTTFKSITKYFRLIVLRSNLGSNLAKFVNLASNFTHRDPSLENAKF